MIHLRRNKILFSILLSFVSFTWHKSSYSAACDVEVIGYGEENCSICLEAVQSHVKQHEYLVCGHDNRLCKHCLQRIGICPICREFCYARLFFISLKSSFSEETKKLIDSYRSKKYMVEDIPNFEFIKAAGAGNLDRLKELLAIDNINIADISFAIIISSINNHIEILSELLKLDKDIKAHDLSFALILTCFAGNLEIANLLLDNGADVNYMGKIGVNSLIGACLSDVEIVKLLISHGADVNAKCNIGYNMLIGVNNLTFKLGEKNKDGDLQEGVVALNLKYNGVLPSINKLIEDIHSFNKNLDLQDLIIKKIQLFREVFDTDYDNTLNITPLNIAVLHDKFDVIEELLSANAEKGLSTLNAALLFNKKNISRRLLSDDAIDVNGLDEIGMFPLMIYSDKIESDEDIDILETILNKKADINMVNADGNSALMNCAALGNAKAFEELMARGANLHQVSHGGTSILMHAVLSGNSKLVKKIIEAGIDVNATEVHHKYNALMLAVLKSKYKMAKKLLKHGANINHQNEEGNTALMLSIINEDNKMAKLLISYRADINIINKEGKTALMIAEENENTRMVAALSKLAIL